MSGETYIDPSSDIRYGIMAHAKAGRPCYLIAYLLPPRADGGCAAGAVWTPLSGSPWSYKRDEMARVLSQLAAKFGWQLCA